MTAPVQPAPPRMTAEEFLDWVGTRPGGRYELIDGQVARMASERVRHAEVKAEAFLALRSAIRSAGLECQVFTDGMAVRTGERSVFEPDASVRCGPRLPPDDVLILDPVIVVEVISPSSEDADTGRKFRGYFSIPTLCHYLVLDPVDRVVVHHRRTAEGRIESLAVAATAPSGEGPPVLGLDPPGLTIVVADLFEAP